MITLESLGKLKKDVLLAPHLKLISRNIPETVTKTIQINKILAKSCKSIKT